MTEAGGVVQPGPGAGLPGRRKELCSAPAVVPRRGALFQPPSPRRETAPSQTPVRRRAAGRFFRSPGAGARAILECSRACFPGCGLRPRSVLARLAALPGLPLQGRETAGLLLPASGRVADSPAVVAAGSACLPALRLLSGPSL